MEYISTVIVSVLGSSVLTTFIIQFFGKKKSSAEAAALVNADVMKWASVMQDDIRTLKQDFRDLQIKHDKLVMENVELRVQVVQLQHQLMSKA